MSRTSFNVQKHILVAQDGRKYVSVIRNVLWSSKIDEKTLKWLKMVHYSCLWMKICVDRQGRLLEMESAWLVAETADSIRKLIITVETSWELCLLLFSLFPGFCHCLYILWTLVISVSVCAGSKSLGSCQKWQVVQVFKRVLVGKR